MLSAFIILDYKGKQREYIAVSEWIPCCFLFLLLARVW
jgi:hypothetical protein